MEYPIVHRVVGRFMELPRDHVNAYIVEQEASVVVVDTTLALSSARQLRQQAESLGKPIEAVLVTHGHPDHYTGLVAFGDIPAFASQGCLEFAQREDVTKSAVAASYLGDDYPGKRVFPNEIVSDRSEVALGGTCFTFLDLGPGESDADGLWYFDKGGVRHAFTGDVVALNCHCFFRDGHAMEWLKNLGRLEAEFDDATRLYLGHGTSPSGMEAVDWQRGYIKAFLHAAARLTDDPDPAGRPAQERLIAAMKRYLPSDATLFLLDYELDVTIPRLLGR